MFADMKWTPALQSADLLAYEITKELSNQDKRPDDRMRWPLDKIITDQAKRNILFIKYITREYMSAQAQLIFHKVGEDVVSKGLDEMMRIYRLDKK